MRSFGRLIGASLFVLAACALGSAPMLAGAHPTHAVTATADTAPVVSGSYLATPAFAVAPVLIMAPALDTAAALHVLVPKYSSDSEVLTNSKSVIRGPTRSTATDTAYIEAVHRAANRHLRSRWLDGTAERLAFVANDDGHERVASVTRSASISPFRACVS
jgi:hypothetical protein